MLSEKKQEKLERILGVETIKELEAMLPSDLDTRISKAEGAIKQAKDELEANPNYREAKDNLKALSEGMKEVRKRQRAVVEYSLHLIEEAGK